MLLLPLLLFATLTTEELRLGLLNLAQIEELSYRLQYQRATTGALRIGATPKETSRLLATPAERLIDPWGTPYRIEIEGKTFRVIGAGSDRRFDPPTWTNTGQFADLGMDVVDADGKSPRSNYTWLNRMVPNRLQHQAAARRAPVANAMLVRDPRLIDVLRAEETAQSMMTLSFRVNEYRKRPSSWDRTMEPDAKKDQVFFVGKGFARVFDRVAYSKRLMEQVKAMPSKPREPIVVAREPAFGQAVRDSLPKWEFQPGTIDGKPVAVLYTVTISFALE